MAMNEEEMICGTDFISHMVVEGQVGVFRLRIQGISESAIPATGTWRHGLMWVKLGLSDTTDGGD